MPRNPLLQEEAEDGTVFGDGGLGAGAIRHLPPSDTRIDFEHRLCLEPEEPTQARDAHGASA